MRKALGALIGLAAFACLGVGTASADVLFDQSGEPSQFTVRSDRYIIPPTATTMNIRAADDFVVPAGEHWKVDTLNVFGIFDLEDDANEVDPSPPPSQLYVTIYANDAVTEGEPPDTFTVDQPGSVVYDSGTPLSATGGPNYTISIPNPPVLNPGQYWISAQQAGAQYYSVEGDQFTQQWRWQTIPISSGNSALIQTDGANCDSAGPTEWVFWACDNEQNLGLRINPRGGPPPVGLRLAIDGTKVTPGGGGGGGTQSAAAKKCKKGQVLKHGKCQKKKKKPKAKKVDPGFTG